MLVALLLACAARPSGTEPAPQGLAEPPPRGLSGLARDAEGLVWAVEERGHRLVRRGEGEDWTEALPIQGVPEDLDLESLAVLPDGRLLFGTESQAPEREGDLLLVGERRGAEVVIVEQQALAYALFGLRAEKNRGVEGLCVAGEAVLALGEMVVEADGGRAAVAWWVPALGATPRPLRLGLVSGTGKLSAADCRVEGEGIRLWAIERHYEVMRLSSWWLQPAAAQGVLTPEWSVDLAGRVADWVEKRPNLEGLVVTADGELLLVNDNDHGGVQGDSRLWRLRLDSLEGAR